MKFGKKGRYDREDPFRWWRVFETRRPTTVHRTREFSFIGTLPKVMMRLSVVPVGMILMTIAMNTLRPYNYVIVPNRVSCGRIYMDVHKVPTYLTVYERGSSGTTYWLPQLPPRCLLSSMHQVR